MASKNTSSSAAGQDSAGLSWADQWGNHDDDADNSSLKEQNGQAGGSGNKKFQEYEKKMKAAASTGFVKAKAAASIGAQKVKSGTSTGINWIKEQYQKRSSK